MWTSHKLLARGSKMSCNCLRRELLSLRFTRMRAEGKLACAPMKLGHGMASARALFTTYGKQAAKRKLSWGVDWEMFQRLTSSHCHYCGLAPYSEHYGKAAFNGAYVYNGIDRVDSSVGYEPGNIVPCCRRCNIMKNTMSAAVFLEHVERIVEHQNQC